MTNKQHSPTLHLALTHSQLFLEMSDLLLHLQQLRVNVGGGIGRCGRAAREQTVLLAEGCVGHVQLLVVVLLQRDLHDAVVLRVSLFGYMQEVAVGRLTQTLQCSGERERERGGGGAGGGGGGGGGERKE